MRQRYKIDINRGPICLGWPGIALVLTLKVQQPHKNLSPDKPGQVSYELSAPRFAVESKRRTKRGLQYEKAIFPKQSYGLGVVQPDGVGKLVFTFDKIALTRGQVFRVYFYEKGGARNFVLTLSAGDVNGARRLN